ncbi:acyltransferase domain-containing protein [Kitasatospora sp. NPDC092039]|uniref:acyltransferase domain-containing protein n=1 Tax=Kitasatospora sp. NPDC092039 TaxID=3364086 RepID=UPI00382A3C1D
MHGGDHGRVSGTDAGPTNTGPSRADGASAVLLPVSGTGPAALTALADHYDGLLAQDGVRLRDLAYSAGALGRHLGHRRAGVVDGTAAARDWLADLRLTPPDGPAPAAGPAPLVFVFSGQGNQWPGMALGLYGSEPEARRTLDASDAVLRRTAGWSLLDAYRDPAGLDDPARLQPALVALQVAIARQLTAWGVVADAYVGHSLGELSAAAASGALDLADVLALASRRGELMREAAGSGLTALVALPADEVERRIAAHGGDAEVAAWNAPGSTLIAGDEGTVRAVVGQLTAEEVFARVLPGTVAFHSSRVEAVAGRLADRLPELRPRPADARFVSTVTGATLDGSELGPEHWADNIRRPVRFLHAVRHLLDTGHRAFVEIGAHPTLAPALNEAAEGGPVLVVPTLRRGEPERAALLTTAARLYEAGAALDFSALAPADRRPVRLRPVEEQAGGARFAPAGRVFGGLRLWRAHQRRTAGHGRFGWRGRPLASFALAADTALSALAAGVEGATPSTPTVENTPAAETPAAGPQAVDLRLEVGARLLTDGRETWAAVPVADGAVELQLLGDGGVWHIQALAEPRPATGPDRIDLAAARARATHRTPAGDHYRALAAHDLAPAAELVAELHTAPDGHTLLRLAPAPAGPARQLTDLLVHAAVLAGADRTGTALPVEFTALRAPGGAAADTAAWVLLGPAEPLPGEESARTALVLDEDGRVLAAVARLRQRRVDAEVLAKTAAEQDAEHAAEEAPREAGGGIDPAALASAPLPERTEAVTAFLREQLGRVLRLPAARIDTARPLNSLGVDSIMGLELQRRLETALRTEVKVVRLLRGDSVDDLAADLAARLAQSPADGDGPPAPVGALDDPRELERLLADMDNLSAEEIDTLMQHLATGTAEQR